MRSSGNLSLSVISGWMKTTRSFACQGIQSSINGISCPNFSRHYGESPYVWFLTAEANTISRYWSNPRTRRLPFRVSISIFLICNANLIVWCKLDNIFRSIIQTTDGGKFNMLFIINRHNAIHNVCVIRKFIDKGPSETICLILIDLQDRPGFLPVSWSNSFAKVKSVITQNIIPDF